MAGFPVSHMRMLMVGIMMTSGTGTAAANNGIAVPDVPIIVGRQMDADQLFGQGSELACMVKSALANNFGNELWCLPVAEPPGGVAGTGTITVSTPPTEAGTIALYIAGIAVHVNIGATSTVTDVAAAIADAINDPLVQGKEMPVTATASAAVVTLKCKWHGKNGDMISMSDSYYGKLGGEELPPGLKLTYSVGAALAGGVGVPDFTNAIANMGETEFEFVALPYTDSTSLLAWETEYSFGDTGRWGWMRQHFGHIFSAKKDTYSNLVTWGLSRNGRILSVMGIEPQSPSPEFNWCACYAAKAARALINDPARPLQTLHLEGILPAPFHQLFNLPELNTLAYSGIATQRTIVPSDGPMISRESTTYQVNEYGFGDDAFELVTTLATLAKLIRNQRYAITTKFPRHKLADDDTKFGPGQAIVTPKIIKAELVAEYAIDEWNGLVENMSAFKDHLIVERDPNDPNRVNVLYPPDLINQLRMFAVLAQFRLQYNRGIDTAIL